MNVQKRLYHRSGSAFNKGVARLPGPRPAVPPLMILEADAGSAGEPSFYDIVARVVVTSEWD
jgi:hypothetical protein